MQAVILAGGRGIRLGGMTNRLPKPMIDVNGRPFLEHLIMNLKENGIKDIVICAGYLHQKMVDYFKDGSILGVKITFSIEKKILGTGGALKNAKRFLNRNFFLINGDTYLPIDYKSAWMRFRRLHKKGLIVLCRDKDRNGNASVQENLVTRYDKKSKGMDFTDAGLQIFSRDVLKMIPKNCTFSLENKIFQKLSRQGQMVAYITDKRFYDMGTLEGLRIIRGILK